ncbi:hypothetical protein FB45DRAFT_886248 [Roridomyces roridus]|uniref:Uncharacterized protein n=1 Tax=Roridomyces roridus TaxID=1738132 RepID=A0AAD7G1K3_9AGAR|nr:hypothetical protein FB45DRAFT_886248 [Roridomyces roridus]
MPLLRTAFVSPSDSPDPGTAPSATAAVLFPLAPMLSQVSLEPSCSAFAVTLPWSQLTTLTAYATISEAIHILHQSTALKTCTLGIYHFDPAPALGEVSTLPIRSLSLLWEEGNPDSSVQNLVNALTLPLLDNLVVSEFLLGSDPVAALSRLRPQGHPRQMEIMDARFSLYTYKASFPWAKLSVTPFHKYY